MRRRVALAVLLASLSVAGVVGVHLARPSAGDAHEVAFSEPPDEVAYDALAQLDDRDYAVEWRVPTASDGEAESNDEAGASDGSDDYRVFLRVTVEGSENRLLARPSSGPLTFATDHCSWTVRTDDAADGRPDETNDRRPDRCSFSGAQSPAPFYGVHANWSAVRDANVTVVRENASAVVLRVNDTGAAYAITTGADLSETAREDGLRANLTLVVDRDAGHLRRLECGISHLSGEDSDRTREYGRTVYAFSEWGDASVDRPDWAGYSLAEFLLDATR
ncbi:hypothetical protein [Halorussus halobius]|uniref:hypothetical protein n=1 Tax=Halorussus halobius TaxID=1710537 RepID=UPI00143DF596|nr:hypothetical protein [Halorussus halobius]